MVRKSQTRNEVVVFLRVLHWTPLVRLNFLPSTYLMSAGFFIKPTVRNKLSSELITLWAMVVGQAGFAFPLTNVDLNGTTFTELLLVTATINVEIAIFCVCDWTPRWGLFDIMVWKLQTLTEVVFFSKYCIALLYGTAFFSENILCAGFFDTRTLRNRFCPVNQLLSEQWLYSGGVCSPCD